MIRKLYIIVALIVVNVGLTAQSYHVGDLYTAPDRSQGIVYYLYPDGSGGLVVALNDVSDGCIWGGNVDVPGLRNQTITSSASFHTLQSDTDGYSNTLLLREFNLDENSASGLVDFDNGWFLPSPWQIRLLFGQLALIDNALVQNGGSTLQNGFYWSSAECSATQAWGLSSHVGIFCKMDKTSLRRVREVRSFSYRTNPDQNLLWNTGDTTRSVTVTPAQTTTYSVTVSSPTGCDGVEQHTIVVNMPDTVEMEHTVCEHYDWNGTTYTESGDYTQTFTNQFGCDSIVTLHLTVNYGTHNVTDTTVCESFTWTDGTGETYTVSGTYIYDYTNSDGCPSADTLHLTVNYGTHNVTDTTVCESYTWAGGSGETYTVSGTYIYDYTNRDGCPSADTLHLTVNYGTHNVTDTAVCESYTWTGGTGDTYTESGTYTFSYTNAAGCASTDTLHLAVHHAVYELVETTACESYEWNGQFYTESGDYTQTFVNQYGCDSVVTLHLMVNRGTHHVTDTAVCGSYTWTAGTGDTYTESGTYTFRYTNADGCPSADTLHLSMMDLIAVTVAATTDTVCPGDSVTLYADAIAPSMVDSHVPPVAVGDILCTDNSIVKPSEWPVPGKTAMGIVCYVDNSDEHGWAIHLHDYGTRVAWSTTSTDISGLANFATGVTAITDLDGYTNTQRIRSAGNASTYPAAYAVDFAQGWYLPASAQMRCVYSKIPILNASLQMVGGTPFSMTAIWGYWSSTEADSSRAWHLDENGQITSYYKTTNYLVRSARNF